MTIGDRWTAVGGRPSGFDYMRIALATIVVAWHAYQMSYGTDAALAFWTGSPLGWALQLVLPMFFALSGYLVSGSMFRNPDLRVFLTLRAIRIFPALVVEVTLAAFVLGPLVTSLSLHDYVTSPILWQYLLNMLGYIHYVLPGVFEHNAVPHIVNSQLWTVPFELEAYILISALALAGMFGDRRRVIPLFLFATVAVAAWNKIALIDPAPPGGVSGRVLVLCFFGGIVVYAYRDKLPWKPSWALASAILAAVAIRIQHGAPYAMPIFAAYLTVYLGLLNPRRTRVVESGDFSYGLYLYAGPIQQTVALLLGGAGGMIANLAISLPVGIGFALFSWWCVEKPFLRVRRVLLAKPSPAPAKADVDRPILPDRARGPAPDPDFTVAISDPASASRSA